MKYSIIILTTKQNFVWHSMQEIIPNIERQWQGYAESRSFDISVINVDDKHRFQSTLSKVFTADLIVVTAFNVKIGESITILRGKLGLSTPLVFYLHNQATIACWPLAHWGIVNLFTDKDIFISTCQKDRDTIKAVFSNVRSELIPFYYNEDSLHASLPVKVEGKKFVYIGRISEQKNLHTLLMAFHNLKKKGELNFTFELYGGEDSLGSPNMAKESSPYLDYLLNLVSELGLQESIIFHGHKRREELFQQLAQGPFIFISPSLHSDENFGMAALTSLCIGAKAILSDWGGHHDFKKYFAHQVSYVPVVSSSSGPFLNFESLIQALEQTSMPERLTPNLPKYYTKEWPYKIFDTFFEEQKSARPLERTPLANAVYEAYQSLSDPKKMKIFSGYEDPLANKFFELYGAKGRLREQADRSLIIPFPWVQLIDGVYEINDPHRGHFRMSDLERVYSAGFAFKRS